jgi:hypothetical protein
VKPVGGGRVTVVSRATRTLRGSHGRLPTMRTAAWVMPLASLALCCGGETSDDRSGVGGSGGGAGSGNGSYSECVENSDCTVAPASCCGSCGAATRSDSVGLNRARSDEYRASVCGDDGCPACFQTPDPTLVPTCAEGICRIVDLQAHLSTSCVADADCRVRTQSCCECGGDTSPGTLVAISDEGSYSSLVCDPDQACGECAPVYPSEATARCTGGYCSVVDSRMP